MRSLNFWTGRGELLLFWSPEKLERKSIQTLRELLNGCATKTTVRVTVTLSIDSLYINQTLL